MDIIAVDKSAKAAAKDAQDLVDGVRENMHEFLLYGIPKQELEAIIARVFQDADKDNSGTLDKNVRSACRSVHVHPVAGRSHAWFFCDLYMCSMCVGSVQYVMVTWTCNTALSHHGRLACEHDIMGMVVIQEFKICLQTAELSLTRKDINLLMAKVDVDGDGCINYHEFVPICFGILVERFADQVMSSSALSSEDGFNVAILRYFNELDVEGVPLDNHCFTRHVPGCRMPLHTTATST